jgi:hypothetical protein
MAQTNKIVELSLLIAQQTALINDYFEQNKLPTPSLDAHALQLLPIANGAAHVNAARDQVIEACSELKALLTGPRELVRFQVCQLVFQFVFIFMRPLQLERRDGTQQ